jgi:hypothetical protein
VPKVEPPPKPKSSQGELFWQIKKPVSRQAFWWKLEGLKLFSASVLQA